MLISPTRVTDDRRLDLLAAAARARLIAEATSPSLTAPPRAVGRLRASLLSVLGVLATLVAIG